LKYKTILLRIVSLAILLFCLINCNDPNTDEIKPVRFNGKSRFIIGNYHNPQDLNELEIYAKNGFNLVRCAPDTNALDMVKDAGLYAWLNTGGIIDFSKEPNKHKKKLTELVNRFKDHPALAVWEVPDEALWNLGYPKLEFLFYGSQWSQEQQDSILKVLSIEIPVIAKGIAEGCKHLRNLDPLHPIWMNHAPRNTLSQLRLFSKSADIVGCDIYPEKEGMTGHSDIIDHSLSAVGGYTDIMQNSAPGKPIWMVLQAFSWELLQTPLPEHLNPEMFPSYKHSRIMAWNAILHGAKGILYWGSYKVSSKSLFWDSILGVTKEIAALESFLVGNELKDSIKIEPIQFTSSITTRVAATLRKHNDDYLLVVMQEDLGQALNVSGLDFIEGKMLYELTTDRSYLVKNGRIRVWFGKEPHVLCTSRKYDVVHESQFALKWDNKDNFPLNEKK
jgi:hypothetical protein